MIISVTVPCGRCCFITHPGTPALEARWHRWVTCPLGARSAVTPVRGCRAGGQCGPRGSCPRNAELAVRASVFPGAGTLAGPRLGGGAAPLRGPPARSAAPRPPPPGPPLPAAPSAGRARVRRERAGQAQRGEAAAAGRGRGSPRRQARQRRPWASGPGLAEVAPTLRAPGAPHTIAARAAPRPSPALARPPLAPPRARGAWPQPHLPPGRGRALFASCRHRCPTGGMGAARRPGPGLARPSRRR